MVHEKEFTRKIVSAYGKNILEELFEQIYYSHHIGCRKPQKEIFELVLRENDLAKPETIFIDDSLQHVEGAKRVGLNAILFRPVENSLEAVIAAALNSES